MPGQPDHLESAAKLFRDNRTVFIAPLGGDFRHGSVRRQTHDAMVEIYSGLGDDLVPLPLMSIEARAGFRDRDHPVQDGIRETFMYQRACRRDDLVEGGFEAVAIDRRLVLILWPKGGMPRAFQGFCPHAREPLIDGCFDGRTLVCRHHDWVFDARNGRCVEGKTCRLAEYRLKVDDDDVLIDVEDVPENYA